MPGTATDLSRAVREIVSRSRATCFRVTGAGDGQPDKLRPHSARHRQGESTPPVIDAGGMRHRDRRAEFARERAPAVRRKPQLSPAAWIAPGLRRQRGRLRERNSTTPFESERLLRAGVDGSRTEVLTEATSEQPDLETVSLDDPRHDVRRALPVVLGIASPNRVDSESDAIRREIAFEASDVLEDQRGRCDGERQCRVRLDRSVPQNDVVDVK